MLIGVPLRTVPGGTHVAVTPETARNYKAQEHTRWVRSGAGAAISAPLAPRWAQKSSGTAPARPVSRTSDGGFLRRLAPVLGQRNRAHPAQSLRPAARPAPFGGDENPALAARSTRSSSTIARSACNRFISMTETKVGLDRLRSIAGQQRPTPTGSGASVPNT